MPQVSNGNTVALSLIEPSCSSDGSAVWCKVVKSADGSLNGSEIWISNGGLAEIFTVFAHVTVKTTAKGETKNKVTAFIVERGLGGVSNGIPEDKMSIKCSNTTELYFEDVKIPAENFLGREGQGFTVGMQILNNGRYGMAADLSETM